MVNAWERYRNGRLFLYPDQTFSVVRRALISYMYMIRWESISWERKRERYARVHSVKTDFHIQDCASTVCIYCIAKIMSPRIIFSRTPWHLLIATIKWNLKNIIRSRIMHCHKYSLPERSLLFENYRARNLDLKKIISRNYKKKN